MLNLYNTIYIYRMDWIGSIQSTVSLMDYVKVMKTSRQILSPRKQKKFTNYVEQA